jgi:hypothetical protein
MNYQPGVGGLLTETMTAPRRMAVVRITHSIVVLSVAGPLVTGGGFSSLTPACTGARLAPSGLSPASI